MSDAGICLIENFLGRAWVSLKSFLMDVSTTSPLTFSFSAASHLSVSSFGPNPISSRGSVRAFQTRHRRSEMQSASIAR
jgi:hypothetical protein